MSDTAGNQQVEKRKIGRPKKNSNSSHNSISTPVTMQKQQDSSETLP
ncbi:MAG: cobalamin biosynthesis protein CobQ, partial [Nostocaceae cyanobacterium CSU_2_110]|nr:cobalamin biosynthesis protein CobQ [Nostocaceae cyanobacterium CSU_2_110]